MAGLHFVLEFLIVLFILVLLCEQARPILNHVTEGGSYEELVDPLLGNDYNPQEMLRMVACAAACIRHSARRRPKMSQVGIVLVVESICYFFWQIIFMLLWTKSSQDFKIILKFSPEILVIFDVKQ